MAENTGNIGFEETLWKAADKLRGSKDASEYKHVVLGLIFLKYISDKFETKFNALVEEGAGFDEDRGNVVHYGFIETFIENLGMKCNIREIAFDPWGAVQMTQNLENSGFTVVPFGQGFKDMSPPTKELMKLTLEQKIAHGGHPVLRWMMDNIFIRTDPAGNIKADKEKSTEKIDGALATIMALDRAIRGGGETCNSVYDDRGLLVF